MSEDEATQAEHHDPTAAETAGTPTRSWQRRLIKAVLLLIVIAAAVVVLFTWVFPWVEEVTQNPTLGVQFLRAPR